MKTRSKTDSKWKQLFGTDSFEAIEQSTKFVKKFTAIAISQILYSRTTLTDDTFIFMKMGDTMGNKTVMLLPKHPAAKKLCDLIKNAMEAFDKGYLKELTMIFLRSGSQDVLEEHTLTYTNPKSSNSKSDGGKKNDDTAAFDARVKLATWKLIRNLDIKVNTLDDLPERLDMNIRLIYNDSAPKGYNPQGFIAASPKSLQSKFANDESPGELKIGSLQTKWHGIEVKSR